MCINGAGESVIDSINIVCVTNKKHEQMNEWSVYKVMLFVIKFLSHLYKQDVRVLHMK